jgi:ABC-type spermidine/putrescine transport system permease subunit II
MKKSPPWILLVFLLAPLFYANASAFNMQEEGFSIQQETIKITTNMFTGGEHAEIWDFLIFIGRVCGLIVVLVGAILWFTDTNQGRGKALVFSGIMLSIVVQYFVMFPPSFVLS